MVIKGIRSDKILGIEEFSRLGPGTFQLSEHQEASPRQKGGMQRYLLLQNPSLIPGKEEKSTERARRWRRTKRQGPEAVMLTMGRMDSFAVCS